METELLSIIFNYGEDDEDDYDDKNKHLIEWGRKEANAYIVYLKGVHDNNKESQQNLNQIL